MLSLLTLVFLIYKVNCDILPTPPSPCPNVFEYEPTSVSKPNRWYGMITLSTDIPLYGLWLNIALDSKADLLGNWEGDVITKDNTDFKIENAKKKIEPGLPFKVRFFVKYNQLYQVPRLRAIRLNGREICSSNNLQPAVDRPSDPGLEIFIPNPSQENRPTSGQDWDIPNTATTRPPEPVQFISPQNPIGINDIPAAAAQNPPFDESIVRPFNLGGGPVPSQSLTDRPPSRPLPNYEDQEYSDDDNPASEDDYWDGGLLAITNVGLGASTLFNGNRNQQVQCGQVPRKIFANPLVIGGRRAMEGQWPWHIALYRAQTANSKYVCGGTLISQLHVITAAHCVTHKWSRRLVNMNILMVHLGKHNLRTSTDGVQIRFVNKITLHEKYDPMTFKKDAAILVLREPAMFTDWVQPVCLWPENQVDLAYVVGKIGTVVGWGFNDRRMLNEQLTLVEMPIVDQNTCVQSYQDFFSTYTSEYTYCAGFRNGSSTCNGDSGGGMVINMQGSWYIRGIVTLAVRIANEYHCDPRHYVVFTDLAKLLPWIKKTMADVV